MFKGFNCYFNPKIAQISFNLRNYIKNATEIHLEEDIIKQVEFMNTCKKDILKKIIKTIQNLIIK